MSASETVREREILETRKVHPLTVGLVMILLSSTSLSPNCRGFSLV